MKVFTIFALIIIMYDIPSDKTLKRIGGLMKRGYYYL